MKTETYHCDACGEEIKEGQPRFTVKISDALVNQPIGSEPLMDACSSCVEPFRSHIANEQADSYQTRMGREPNSEGSRARSSQVISPSEN